MEHLPIPFSFWLVNKPKKKEEKQPSDPATKKNKKANSRSKKRTSSSADADSDTKALHLKFCGKTSTKAKKVDDCLIHKVHGTLHSTQPGMSTWIIDSECLLFFPIEYMHVVARKWMIEDDNGEWPISLVQVYYEIPLEVEFTFPPNWMFFSGLIDFSYVLFQ
jgi:hypothetical protein